MKIKIIILLMFFGLKSHGQTYVLDPTFGINGVRQNEYGSAFIPKDGLIVGNNYYLISDFQLVKLHYDGHVNTSFATNGIFIISATGKEYEINNCKFLNGYLYLYGNVRNTVTDKYNFFICKVDENGIPDSGFGTNGMVENYDFGYNEYLRDFIFDTNGNLFCIGTRYQNTSGTNNKMITFKVSPTGVLDTGYDPSGFKIHAGPTGWTYGHFIDNYNGKYLLAGAATTASAGLNNLFLTVIDSNGNTDYTYDANGYKTATLYSGYPRIRRVNRINNELYVSYFWAWDFYGQGTKMIKYDLNTNTTVFNNNVLHTSYFTADNTSFFVTGHIHCAGSPGCNGYDFITRKYLHDGSIDSTFNNGGQFTYNSTASSSTTDLAEFHIIDSNGKIVIGGYLSGLPNSYYMIRIGNQATLSNNNNANNSETFFPNPFVDTINISLEGKIKTVEIFDLVGRKVDEPKFEDLGQSYMINTSNITEKGIYLIKIITEDNRIICKKINRE